MTDIHSVLTRCIMNRKLPTRNSNLHDNSKTYIHFCGKIVCFSLLWWNKSSILLIFGKEPIISIVSTYSCPKLEQINHFKWLLNFRCIGIFRNQGRNNDLYWSIKKVSWNQLVQIHCSYKWQFYLFKSLAEP